MHHSSAANAVSNACSPPPQIHQHVTGGGGEAGPASRTPEAHLSQLLSAGTTTVVGVLGTDSVSRSLEGLATKCRALAEGGVTALFWGGGGYSFPPRALTGSAQRDVVLLQGCVGVGELAISDHRGSCPTPQELARLAGEVRVGGMLAGRGGPCTATWDRGEGGCSRCETRWRQPEVTCPSPR
jgi:beta-aspartyl-dipeptidase (metallo-type)